MNLPTSKTREVSLEELGLLCDEIAALSRAGVPLEGGLAGLAGDLPGRMGRFAAEVAERLKAGVPLVDAIAGSGATLPSYFRAAIEAGLRSGRLSAALEGVAGSLRRLADLRRGVGAALVYPLVVLLLAYATLVFLAVHILPTFARANGTFQLPSMQLLQQMVAFGVSSPLLWLLPPALFLSALATWWWAMGQAITSDSGGTRAVMFFWPGFWRVQRDSRAAVEADVLALLIEHDVPLPEAIELAGDAAGDRRTRMADAKIAAALRRGETLAAASRSIGDDSPVVRWMLLGGAGRETLVAALRHAALGYERRATNRAELVRTWFPLLVTVLFGGGAVLLVGLVLFIPFTNMMQGLAQ